MSILLLDMLNTKFMKGGINMKKFGFTLAEVLIVLVILGVISALTVPNLMGTADEKARITAFKKGYAEINNALQLASAENGATPRAYTGKVSDLIADVFVPTMKLTKIWTSGFQTADGITYLIVDNNKSSSTCGSIPTKQSEINLAQACFIVVIDSNGLNKGPNSLSTTAAKGYINDRFILMMFENGVITGESVAGAILAHNIYNNSDSAANAAQSYSAKISGTHETAYESDTYSTSLSALKQ